MYSKDTSLTTDRTPRRFAKPVARNLPGPILWLVVLAGVIPGLTGCDVQNVFDSLLARNTWAMLHPLSITSVTPPSGSTAGGTDVTIRGTGFDSGVGVLFGEHAAVSVEFVNEGLMRATTPPQDAGQVPIVLLSPYGQAVETGASFAYLEPASPLPVPLSITSITPNNGPTSGGTIVTIKGTGFVEGLAITFDGLAAPQVQITNGELLTAVTPPHTAAIIDLTLATPDLRSATLAGTFEYALDADGDGVADVDTDGDGVSDQKELEGWDVWVDYFGVGMGTDTFGNTAGLYHVTSDPHNPDTDGDGLNDYLELQLPTDPRNRDTDNDGIYDAEEVLRWRTSPVSVDTDGDCRGPTGALAPNSALFDGRELYTAAEIAKAPGDRTLRTDATSPTLADTDGDSHTDYEELEDPTRSPLIADLPLVAIDLEDAVDIRLDVQYAEEQGTSYQYGETLTETDTWDSKFSYELMAGVEAGAKWGTEAEASAGVLQWGKAKTTLEFSLTLKSESTWNWEWSHSHSDQSAYSKATTDSRTMTETAASGSMTAGVRISNPGNIAYHLDNMAITVRYWERIIDPDTGKIGGVFKTMATLTPPLAAGVTLAPGESTPVLQVQAVGINADRIKQFLAHPSSLALESPYFDLQAENGVSFAFVEEVTQTRTANLLIDFGGGIRERYCLATNVDRTPEGGYVGLNLYRVMTQFLGIPVETVQQDDHGNPIVSTLVKVRSLPTGAPAPLNGWLVLGTNDDFADPNVRFEDITLHAGDSVMLVVITDTDDDGLNQQEEDVYGTGDGDDCDGDGLSDLDEAKTHRNAADELVEPGWMVRVKGQPAYRVLSDPREADADGDDLNDLAERGGCAVNGLLAREYANEIDCTAQGGVWHPHAGMGCVCGEGAAQDCSESDNQTDCEAHGGVWTPLGTDPTLTDTDGDGLLDGTDPAPLTRAPKLHVAPGAVDGDGLSWANAHNNLAVALADAAARNGNADPEDDIAEIWVAAGTYTLNSEQALLSNLGLYGGFVGGEDKRDQRNADPFTNGTAIVGQAGQDHGAFRATNVRNVVLDGFTMSDWATYSSGGALGIYAGTEITIRNMQFINNQATYWGGAIYADGYSLDSICHLAVSNCVFAGNEAEYYGGAIECVFSHVAIINSEFVDNQAKHTGGAICAEHSELDCSTSRFEGNRSGRRTSGFGSGGAACLFTTPGTFTNCRFAYNTSMGQLAEGGGINASSSDYLALTNCVFWCNSSRSTGSGDGGVLRAYGVDTVSLINCTIAGNVSIVGFVGQTPAVLWGDGFLRVHNSIVACNGEDPSDAASCGPNIGYIVMGNPNPIPTLDEFFISHTCVYPDLDDIGGMWRWHSLMTNHLVDPGFASGWETSGILQLSADSPLIDRGSNFVDIDPATPGVQFLPEIDFADAWRIVDGNADGCATVDLGAYELQGGGGG